MSKKSELFIQIAKPNSKGFSREVKISELSLELRDNNGKAWSRENDLGAKFYMIKKYERGKINTKTDSQKSSGGLGKLLSIQLDGYK